MITPLIKLCILINYLTLRPLVAVMGREVAVLGVRRACSRPWFGSIADCVAGLTIPVRGRPWINQSLFNHPHPLQTSIIIHGINRYLTVCGAESPGWACWYRGSWGRSRASASPLWCRCREGFPPSPPPRPRCRPRKLAGSASASSTPTPPTHRIGVYASSLLIVILQ